MNRDAFLARVRETARAGQAYRVRTRAVPHDAGYIGAGDDPVARMAAEVTAVGGTAHVAADRAAARDVLREIITLCGAAPRRSASQLSPVVHDRGTKVPYSEQSARTALCWQHPVLDRLGLADLLASMNMEMLTHDRLSQLPPAEQRARALAAEIGITSTTYAVAETGTLAVAAAPGQERVASLLPPVHVAVVEASQILPDLFDLFARMSAEGPTDASNWTLITGPSKTGDIELKLTTGVHGPGQWHVVLINASAP